MLKMRLKKLVMLVVSVLLVSGTILAGGCAGGSVESPSQIIEDITTQEAFAMIQDNQNNADFVILDVRTQEEVDEGYIENAINIDFYSKTFRDEIDRLDKEKTYLIYCRSGSRSGRARDMMEELNFRKVYNMLGGIVEWKADGLPIVK